MNEWEVIEGGIDAPGNSVTERLAVPGGWLYRSIWAAKYSRFGTVEGSGVTFVPGSAGDTLACEPPPVAEIAHSYVVPIPSIVEAS